jgi:carbonic anhydrase
MWMKGAGYAACAGTEDQSPINATFATAVPYSDPMATLNLSAFSCASAEFLVNEHTAEVAFPAETCGSSFNATWKGKVYSLAQFHYHAPSEHMVDGEYYPMEVHHVHKAVDGTVLVLGVFMYVNPALSPSSCVGITIECSRAKFFDAILTLGQGSHAAALAAVRAAPPHSGPVLPVGSWQVPNDPYNNFVPMMNGSFSYFYYYMGSFTTPPCTTGVSWILAPTPVAVFDSSVTAYRTLINALQGSQLSPAPMPQFRAPISGQVTWDVSLGNNNRQVQPLGARMFYKVMPAMTSTSFTTTGTVILAEEGGGSSSGGDYWKWGLLFLLLCCCLAGIAALGGKNAKKKPLKKKKKDGSQSARSSASGKSTAREVVPKDHDAHGGHEEEKPEAERILIPLMQPTASFATPPVSTVPVEYPVEYAMPQAYNQYSAPAAYGSYAPSYGPGAMPMTSSFAPATTMSYPMTTGYGGYSTGAVV